MPMVAVATGRQRARSFGAQADLYDRLRPSYPADLVTAVLPADAHRVADIGAGTGKLAALLHECGLAVTAVEPDPAMRAVLAERVPAADVRIGVGESLPLADADVDAVLYGQAWHWVDPDRAANEARRVLRADGTLGLLWNMHDDRVPWVARLLAITGSEAAITGFPDPPPLPGFAPPRRIDVDWHQRLTPAELVDLTRTWSTVSTRPGPARDRVMADVRQLLESTSELVGLTMIDLPYVCTARVYRCRSAVNR